MGYFIFHSTSLGYEKRSELLKLKNFLDNSRYTNDLIHELQKERGLSAGYISSQKKDFFTKLLIQRKLTDKKIIILQNKLLLNDDIYIKSAIKSLKDLPSIRIKIDTKEINPTKIIELFSDININLLNHISYFLTISTESKISKMIFSYINLLKAKENSGIERAVLNSAFASGNMSDEYYRWFSALYSTQQTYLDNFKHSIKPKYLEYFNSKMDNPAINQVTKLREIAFDKVLKNKIISNIKYIIGYGGLIHNFKNYLIRGDEKYAENFNTQYIKLLQSIQQYKDLSTTTKKELESLDKIESIFSNYQKNLLIIQKNKNSTSIKNIDKIVKIDDEAAIKNIKSLGDNILGDNAILWYEASTKRINILMDIEKAYALDIDYKMKQIIGNITQEQIFNFLLISIVFIFIFIFSSILIIDITTSIKKIGQGLVSFSEYIRGSTSKIEPIEINSNDEFAQMAKIVNKNIQKTKEYLDKKVQEETKKKTLLLAEFNIELENQIDIALKENTKQLQLLQEQNKLAAMGEMIGAIAHQWRQPLNELGINIQNLEYDYIYEEIDEKFIKEFIEANYNTIQYMSHTIDDFKNFFRIDKMKSNFSVKETTNIVYTMISAQFDRYEIDVEISGDDFLYNGFQSEFQQVILNILNNAKDALLENQIKNPKINIKFESNKVFIQDNAGGIPLNIIDRIFEPYYTSKEQGKGTGIGLYMSKTIIEKNMNSKLEVKNINNGACFKITLN